MSRSKLHRLVVFLCALTLGLILGGYALHRFREITGHLDRVLVQQLETQLGRAARSGRVTVSRDGQFTIRNLQIAEGKTFKGGTFLQVDRVEGKINFLSPGLWRNEPIRAMERIEFFHPQITLVRSKTGSWNFNDLIKGARPGAKPVRFAGVAALHNGSITVRDFAARLPAASLPAVNSLSSLEGTLDGRTAAGFLFQLTAKGEKTLGPLHLDGTFDPAGKDGHLVADVRDVNAAYWLDYSLPPNRTVTLRAGRVNLSAQADIVKGKIDPASLQGMAGVTGGVLALSPLRSPLRSIRAQAQAQGTALKVTGSAFLENIPLTLTGGVADLNKPVVDVRASVGTFGVERLPRLIAALPASQWPGLTGPVTVTAQVSGPPKDLKITAKVRSPRLMHQSAVAQGVAGDFLLYKGKLQGNVEVKQAFGGSLTAHANYQVNGPAHPWSVDGRFAGLDVSGIAPPSVPKLSGRTSGSFRFENAGHGTSGRAEVAMAEGSAGPFSFSRGAGRLTTSDGKTWNAHVTLARGSVQRFDFRTLVADARVDSGGVLLQSARADAWQGRLKASGRVAKSGAMDLALNADDIRLSQLMATLNQTGYTGISNFDGRLTGTGKDPALTGHLAARNGTLKGIPYSSLEGRIKATPTLLVLQDATLRSGRGRLALSGDVSLRQNRLGAIRMTARLQDVPGSLLSRLDLGPGRGLTLPPILRNSSLSGTVNAAGTLPNLSVGIRQAALDLPRGRATLSGDVALRQGGVRFSGLMVRLDRVPVNAVADLRWNGRRVLPLETVPPELRSAVASGVVTVDGIPSAMRLSFARAWLSLPEGRASLNGTVALGRGIGRTNVAVRLDRVPVALLDGLRLTGGKPLSIPAAGRSAKISGVARITGTPGNWDGAGNLTVGPVVAEGVGGGTVTVQEARTRFTLRGKRIILEETTLLANGQTLRGSGQYTLGGDVDFRLTGNKIPLEMVQPYLGPLARVSGVGSATVTATGKPGTDLVLRFEVQAGPLVVNTVRFDDMSGNLQWDGQRILFNDLRLKRGDSLVYVPAGRFDLHEKTLAMDLQATSVDVETLFDVLENAPVMRTAAAGKARTFLTEFPMPRGGLVSGSISLNGPLSGIQADIDMTGEAVALGQTSLDRVKFEGTWSPQALRVAHLEVESPGIHLTGSGALGGPSHPFESPSGEPGESRPVELALNLSDTQVQEVIRLVNGLPALRRSQLGQRILQAANTPRTPITGLLDAKLAVSGPMDSLQGQLDFNADHLKVGPQEFEVARGSFTIDGRRMRVQNLRIEGGEAVVTAKGTGSFAGALDFDLNVNNLNLQLIAPWVGLPAGTQGMIDVLRVVITGTRDNPVLQASLNASNVGNANYTADFIEAPDIRAADGLLKIGQLLVRKRVPEQPGVEIQTVVNGSLPFTATPLGVPRTGPLDLHARFDEQNLALLSAFFPEVQQAGGTFGGNLDVTGTVGKPLANGAFTLKDGNLKLASFKNKFTNLNGQLIFNQDRITLNDFHLASDKGGDLVATGSASLERFPQGPVEISLRTGQPLQLEGDNVTHVFGERFNGRLAAEINVSGTLANPIIKGFVSANQTDLTLSDKPLPESTASPRFFFPNPTFQEFRIIAGEGFFVRRGTFQGEINGEVLLNGTYPLEDKAPRGGYLSASGRFNIDRGRVRVAAKTFRIQDGGAIAVNYRAPDPPRIRMDLEATTRVYSYSGLENQRKEYQVTVILSGPLDNPNVSFESDPPDLSRQQILAALGYQNQIQAIFQGGAEADKALRQGLAEAFTGVVTPTLLEPFEYAVMRALNLEEFAISYDFDSPLQVQVTKHLVDNFYLTYRRQLTGTGQDYMYKLYYRLTPRVNLSYSTDERGAQTYLVEGRLRF